MDESRRIGWGWLTIILSIVLAADQASKYAVERFTGPEHFRVLIPGFLNLIHTRNPGVAFSLFADARSPWIRLLVVVFSLAVIGFLFWLLASDRAGGRMGQAGVAMILGGAMGNVLDRLARHSVTDFIDLHLRGYHWPTFNVADSAIVVGAALVLGELLRDGGHPTIGKGAA